MTWKLQAVVQAEVLPAANGATVATSREVNANGTSSYAR